MNKKLIASLVGIATLGTAFLANAAIEENQLTVWVNGDKGLLLILIRLRLSSSRPLLPAMALIFSCGLMTVTASGLRPDFLLPLPPALRRRPSSPALHGML